MKKIVTKSFEYSNLNFVMQVFCHLSFEKLFFFKKRNNPYFISRVELDSRHVGKRGYHTRMASASRMVKRSCTGAVSCISVQRFQPLQDIRRREHCCLEQHTLKEYIVSATNRLDVCHDITS